jgi:Xaa-Pro aminopeptidase
MRAGWVVLLSLLSTSSFAAGETREQPGAPEPFAPEVYRARRQKLMGQLKKGVALVLSASDDELSHGHQSADFAYLTGLADEGDAALLLAPEAPPERRELLLLGPFDPERDRWTGYRAMLPSRAVETRLGFAHLGRADRLGDVLATYVQRFKDLHFFGPIVGYKQDLPRALEIAQKATARVPGASVKDAQAILGRLRAAKEPRELDKITRATEISVAGHLEAMRRVRPGMHEWDLKRVLEDEFHNKGARHLSYSSIVGAGPDGCVLHYVHDDRVISDGELVLIDAAAEVDHYASDVTRTFPASGKFSPEQRKIYEVVLAAQKAAIAKVRPGATFDELRQAAEKVIADAGYYDYFIHGIGHHVGLEVHDLAAWASFEPLVEGAVITVEPGIYIPGKQLGVRIEDVVVVTRSGARVLSAALPREPDEIERVMASGRR